MTWSRTAVRGFLPSTTYVTQNASRQIILVMLILGYHIWFQIDFACQCNADGNFILCYSYMLLPSFIIVSLILWNDNQIRRVFRYTCYHSSIKMGRCSCRGKFCFEFFMYFLQATSSGLLWCGSVLIDGNWYVCCGTGNDEELVTLRCMNESEIGPAERARKVNLKNHSMVIGLTCVLLTAFCSFILALPWNKWCTKRNYFRAMFEETILEQTENILLKEMKKAAADSVAKSLKSLSSNSTPCEEEDVPEKEESTEEKGKTLLNINANWIKIASVAGSVIESMPNNLSNHDHSVNFH